MPVPCAVLNVIHPVISVDLHQPWFPPAPPAPPVPHFWLQILGGLQMPTVKRTTTVVANFTSTPIIQQGSDIGPFIVHVSAPHVLLILYFLSSGSVSEFGAFSVQVENRPVGTAIAGFAGINLNCAFPCAMPTGVVVAISTVCAGMKFGDYMASLACMAADVILSALLTLLGMGLGKGLQAGAFRLLGPFVRSGALSAGVVRTGYNAVGTLTMAVLGVWGIGSPVGYSANSSDPANNPLGGNSVIGEHWGNFKDNNARAIADYFNPPPAGVI
jgi:hypothetical protein